MGLRLHAPTVSWVQALTSCLARLAQHKLKRRVTHASGTVFRTKGTVAKDAQARQRASTSVRTHCSTGEGGAAMKLPALPSPPRPRPRCPACLPSIRHMRPQDDCWQSGHTPAAAAAAPAGAQGAVAASGGHCPCCGCGCWAPWLPPLRPPGQQEGPRSTAATHHDFDEHAHDRADVHGKQAVPHEAQRLEEHNVAPQQDGVDRQHQGAHRHLGEHQLQAAHSAPQDGGAQAGGRASAGCCRPTGGGGQRQRRGVLPTSPQRRARASAWGSHRKHV